MAININYQRNKELREYIAQHTNNNMPNNPAPHNMPSKFGTLSNGNPTISPMPTRNKSIAEIVYTDDSVQFIHRKTNKAVITITDDEIIIGCLDGEHIKLDIK